MPDTTTAIIEAEGHPIGIIARDGLGYRFHAVDRRLRPIDGMPFASIAAAKRAAWGLPMAPAGEPPRPGLAVPNLSHF